MRRVASCCLARGAFAESYLNFPRLQQRCRTFLSLSFESRAQVWKSRADRRAFSNVAASRLSGNSPQPTPPSLDAAFPFAASEDTWTSLEKSRPPSPKKRGRCAREEVSDSSSAPEAPAPVVARASNGEALLLSDGFTTRGVEGRGNSEAAASRRTLSAVRGLKELREMQSQEAQQVVVRLLLEGGVERPLWRQGEENGTSASLLSGDVLACLHALELECMYAGLLLADVPREELFRHLREARLPSEEGEGPLLLCAEWLQRQKENIYGRNPYPVPLRWKQRPLSRESQEEKGAAPLSPSASSLEEAPALMRRRQLVAERSVWRRLTEEVKEQTRLLAKAGRIPDTGSARRVWIHWIRDMEPRVAALQNSERRRCESLQNLPLDVDPALLAVIAARTTLQAVLVPKALAVVAPSNALKEDASKAAETAATSTLRLALSSPSPAEASRSSTDSPSDCEGSAAVAGEETPSAFEELQPRQALVTHLAMAIGDAVYAEAAASAMEAQHEREMQRRGAALFKPKRFAKTATAEGGGLTRWSARRRLCVGGLLLKELLQCSFFEAPYLAAKEELALELRQLQAEQRRVFLGQRRRQTELLKKRDALLALSDRAHAKAAPASEAAKTLAVDASSTGGLEAVERFVEAQEACRAADEAGRAATPEREGHSAQAAAALRGSRNDVLVHRFENEREECLRLLETFRSRRSCTKVELPAFRHRVVYCAQTRKKYGVLEMRRLCFDQMTAQDFSHEEEDAMHAATQKAGTAALDVLKKQLGGDSFSEEGQQPLPGSRRLWTSFWLGLKHPPMLVKPLPWKTHDSGGYLLLRSTFVRSVVDGETSASPAAGDASERSSLREEEAAEGREDGEEKSRPSEGGNDAAAAGEGVCPSRRKDKARGGKSSPELFLGWAPRAKVRQDFSVYDSTFVRRAVDGLGSVPWQVSLPVLHAMQRAWQEGGDVGRVPPRRNDSIIAELATLQRGEQESEKQRRTLSRHLRLQLERSRSERPSFLLKLRTAEEFAAASQLFFPHSIDFRGRCYPVPPHLNHMGDDVCRALLRFAEGRPLGERGWFWLKVHLANLFGVNKVAFSERARWTEERFSRIQAVAEAPLSSESRAFWLEADDPWQALAAIFEIAEALRSGDVGAFHSHLPVHLDGSCNGLQHYAALGRDQAGGAAVNLIPADAPSDLYSQVLAVVKEAVEVCASGGPPPLALKRPRRKTPQTNAGQAASTPLLKGALDGELQRAAVVSASSSCRGEQEAGEGFEQEQRRLCELCLSLDVLRRAVVKQTVMTVCYGVTAHGAREQVCRQLELVLGGKVEPEVSSRLGGFLSQLVLQSIGRLFECAMRIKVWLDQLSRLCGRAGVPVAWRVPLVGLLCEQPYRQVEQKQLRSALQRHTLVLRGEATPPARARQRQAFPPNFIHSLDAAHMLLTAHDCLFERKMNFAAVHDSYWTHAGDADGLGEALRKHFVRLYDQDPLALLYEDFKTRLGDQAEGLKPPPPKGSLDVRQVLDSPYFFH